MDFKTLFGLSHLLKDYGIESRGVKADDCRAAITKIAPPFIAQMSSVDFVIVTQVGADKVNYLTQGIRETIPADEFEESWTGVALQAFPTKDSAEPGYRKHAFVTAMYRVRDILLIVCAALLCVYLFVANRVYTSASLIVAMILDMGGIYISVLLMRKSLHISDKMADRFCGAIQEGGCDHVLASDASKVFGIFSWSEVGLAYFSVSLMALLMFPQWACYLSLCNVCCLPFSFWSVWYQRYRAHHWCTLCLGVQATLWLLFACYLAGGWFKGSFPLRIEFFVLGVSYLVALLAINIISPYFKKEPENGTEIES